MTLSALVVWEVRPTGSQNNGGGFKAGASGVDYSQQPAAQYALAAVSSGGASAVMAHASAAAAMVGNVCQVVSGTNATVGWYEIISVNVGVDITVDRNWCTGACANGVVNVGGAFKFGGTLDDEFTEAIVAGNTIYVAKGTHSLAENIAQTTDASATAPYRWIGYTSTRNDVTVGTDRPLIQCAGYNFSISGNYSIFKNFRFTTTYLNGVNFGQHCVGINCKVQNTGAGSPVAFTLSSYAKLIFCEAICNNGTAFSAAGYNAIIACYAHDSVTGYYIGDPTVSIIHSVADTCSTGMSFLASTASLIVNNTIYKCTTGISGTTAYSSIFTNNIITDCTTGASWTTATPINFWNYNCWNNTTDVVNVTKGPNDITADPKLKDPANGDFTLKGGSPCFAAGLSLSSDVGLA